MLGKWLFKSIRRRSKSRGEISCSGLQWRVQSRCRCSRHQPGPQCPCCAPAWTPISSKPRAKSFLLESAAGAGGAAEVVDTEAAEVTAVDTEAAEVMAVDTEAAEVMVVDTEAVEVMATATATAVTGAAALVGTVVVAAGGAVAGMAGAGPAGFGGRLLVGFGLARDTGPGSSTADP